MVWWALFLPIFSYLRIYIYISICVYRCVKIINHTKFEKTGELNLYCEMQKEWVELRWLGSLVQDELVFIKDIRVKM